MTSEALGEALIPVINKLQDIFSQACQRFERENRDAALDNARFQTRIAASGGRRQSKQWKIIRSRSSGIS